MTTGDTAERLERWHHDYPAGPKPVGVALDDLNQDGWLDVVTANQSSNDFGILWNRGIVCGGK